MKEIICQWGECALLTGILTHNPNPTLSPGLCMLFLNAGILPKSGPNRLHVTISRMLAADLISCFRFDYSGTGDSSFSAYTGGGAEMLRDEIRETMDMLSARFGFSEFILCGMCSGAEAAYHMSLQDSRIKGLVLIDGVFLTPEQVERYLPQSRKRNGIRYYRKHLFSIRRWRKLLTGKSGFVKNLLRGLFYRRKQPVLTTAPAVAVTKTPLHNGIWEQLVAGNIKTYLVFSEGGIATDLYQVVLETYLKQFTRGGVITSFVMKDTDHTFTPVWAQAALARQIYGWVSRHYSID